MKSMVELTLVLLNEVGQKAGITTTRDAITIESRVGKEGLSFLTITLPKFCADFELALDLGEIRQQMFSGFSRDSAGLPKFLGGFLRVLFPGGRLDKSLTPEKAATLVWAVRQICHLMKKVELECSPSRVDRAYRDYIELDHGIRRLSDSVTTEFRDVALGLFSRYLTDVEHSLYWDDWLPRYSSGALATRETYNGRFSVRTWTQRLHSVLPWWDGVCFSFRDAEDIDVQVLSRDEEIPSRVTHVPKTLKTPRIIAMEPSWNQSVQQVILAELTSRLSSHPALWAGMGWEVQDFNRLLARIGSEGNLATVDLSSASDLVSNQLVCEGLFAHHKYLRDLIQASRSEYANVRGEIISLKKFASMGSALTFPIECMVFYTAIHMAFKRTWGYLQKTPLQPEDGYRVYGDDIIVPVSVIPSLLSVLEDLGLKVNANKSFWNGSFRESCGADWYSGYGVTPIRMPVPLTGKEIPIDHLRRLVEFRNSLHHVGLTETSAFLDRILRSSRWIPYAPPGVNGIALHCHDESKWKSRFNPHLFRLEYRVLSAKEVKPLDPLDGWGAMMKWITPHDVTTREGDHLNRDGRSKCVSLHTSWGDLQM